MKRRGWRRRGVARALLRRRWPRRLAEAALPPVSTLRARLESGLRQTEEPPREPGGGGPGPPVLLEFIGPSGIGKTTLAKALLANDDLCRAVDPSGGVLARHVALRQCHHCGELDRTDLLAVYPELSALIWRYVLGEALREDDKAEVIRFTARLLTEERQLQCLDSMHLVVSDDAVFHNLAAVLGEFLGRSPEASAFVERRLFVLLRAPVETVVERLGERDSRMVPPVRHRYLMGSQLCDYVADQAELAATLATRLGSMGVPVFDVDVGADGPPDVEWLTSSIIEAFTAMVDAEPDDHEPSHRR